MGGETEPFLTRMPTIRKDNKDMEEICKGDPAWEGTVTGIIRFVHFKLLGDGSVEHNFDEFVEGEILVTEMTDIEFVPTMRRASAILTRTGGVLCHAAIISRELDKPCIVGIREGIDMLKTGDHVTVNATDGIVYRGKVS